MILVVEDEAPIRKLLCDKLNNEGFLTVEAMNGEEGLDDAIKIHPDLIILDLMMFKMNGLTMLKKLREDKWGKNAHVMVLTNSSDNKSVSEIMENQAYDYFVKTNIKLEDFVEKVKEKMKV